MKCFKRNAKYTYLFRKFTEGRYDTSLALISEYLDFESGGVDSTNLKILISEMLDLLAYKKFKEKSKLLLHLRRLHFYSSVVSGETSIHVSVAVKRSLRMDNHLWKNYTLLRVLPNSLYNEFTSE